MSTLESAFEAEFFNNCLDELTKERFFSDIGVRYDVNVDEEDVKKSAWVASVLADSDIDEHKKKALAFAVLLYQRNQHNENAPLYRRYLYTVLSRLGSLPSADVLSDHVDEQTTVNLDQHGSLLGAELDLTEDYYRLDEDTVLSDFQKRVWSQLTEDYVVFSGPTSSGKSFLLRKYVQKRVEDEPNFQGIYLVPSRALISEVSSEFRERLGDKIDIRTGAHLDDVEDNFLLVLTPERCLQLFDYEDDDDIQLDLIFLDEIQGLEDRTRGPLFENVLETLEEIWGDAQIIAAGPNIENPSEALEDIVKGEAKDIKTIFNPVLQLEARFTFYKRSDDISIEIDSPSGNLLDDISVDRPVGLSYSTVKGNKKETIQRFVSRFGSQRQSLIYAKTRNSAEKMAKGIAEDRGTSIESPRCDDLISFLKDSIHEEYSLVKTLDKGVAFHHGSVPQVARDEIESLYRDETLDTIACTPTLLEGVNLPAEVLYIIDPSKGRDAELSDFDFQNLIGRVGRVGTKMYGTIYYIDRQDDEWSEDKIGTEGEKEVTSATRKTIEEKSEELIERAGSADVNEIEDDGLRYTIILLRNRFVKDDQDVREYLLQKGFSEEETDMIRSNLNDGIGELNIPKEVLRKNPTVDPLQQENLYNNVTNNTSLWEINPQNLQENFFQTTRLLNMIFHFARDPEQGIEENLSSEIHAPNLNHIMYTAYHWLSGKSYNQMVNLRRNSLSDSSIDSSIKEVMKIVNQDVRYVLVKYYKVLCDILQNLEDYDDPFMINFDKRLERGTVDSGYLEMMDLGIDRSIVINLESPDGDPEEYLEETAASLPLLYQRHLAKNGIIDL